MQRKKIHGVTLLETMLVLVIVASITYVGIQQYLSYRQTSDLNQVQANVSTLFGAATRFYRAQCYGNINPNDPSSTPIAGTGLLRTTTTSPLIIDIENNFRAMGYLSDTLPLNPIVDDSQGDNGYMVQFNRYTQVVKLCRVGTNAWGPYPSTGCTTASQVGTLVLWKVQVAVALRDPNTRTQFSTMLGADCLSKMVGSQILPCPGDPSGDFAVWERIPSTLLTRDASTPVSAAIPAVQSFTNMYRTSGTTFLMNVSHTPEVQFFYCGS